MSTGEISQAGLSRRSVAYDIMQSAYLLTNPPRQKPPSAWANGVVPQ
jgi:hypothetical protein